MGSFISRLTEQQTKSNYAGYLEGDKASHINTGIKASEDLVVEIKYLSLETYSAVMGLYWDDYGYFLNDWGGTVSFQAFGVTTALGTSDKTNGNTIKLAKGRCTMNGVTTAVTGTSSNSTDYPIHLFAVGSGENSGHRGKIRIYYCRMWQGGVLVRDMWPCYDKDGVACMWDKVTEAYFRNEGTGTFTAGGVSMQKVTFLEYLETTGAEYVDLEIYGTQDTALEVDAEIVESKTTGTYWALAGNMSTSSKAITINPSPSVGTSRFGNASKSSIFLTNVGERHVYYTDKTNAKKDGVVEHSWGTVSDFTTTGHLLLFTLTAGSGKAAWRAYHCKAWESRALILDLWPCYDWGGYPCLYDKVSGQHFYNCGTGSFVAGGVVESSVTFLEWIESSGTQYVNIGFIPNQDTRIVMEATPTSVADAGAGTGFIPYGAGESSNSKAFECYTYNGQYEFNYAGQLGFIGTPVVGQKITIDHNKNVVTVTSESGEDWTYTFTYSAFEAPRSMTLFAIARSTVAVGQMKLHSGKVYDNGTLFGDYRPAYDWCGRACLFDKVSKQFLPNAGTGEFIAGGVAA